MTTDMDADVDKDNKDKKAIWIRGLFMLLFLVIYGVAEVVVAAVAVIQFGWVVVTEERNPRLERLGASASEFIYEIVCFWTFVSERKPFPFSDWPTPRGASGPFGGA